MGPIASKVTYNTIMDFSSTQFAQPPASITEIWERQDLSKGVLSPWAQPWSPPPPGSQFAPTPWRVDTNPFKPVTNRYWLYYNN